MRKLLFFLLIIANSLIILANETKVVKYPEKQTILFGVSAITGYTKGMSIGVGKSLIYNDANKEIIYKAHYQCSKNIKLVGGYCEINSFRTRNNLGFYYQIIGGVDYVEGSVETFSFGGTNEDNIRYYEGVYPNLAFGFGYALKIFSRSSIRLCGDLGIKKNFYSIKFSYVY